MPKFSRTKYDPRAESTPGFEEDGKVVLHQIEGGCPCGCETRPLSKGRLFAMGHDARFRGKLIRAALTGTPVKIVSDGDGKALSKSARDTALDYGDSFVTAVDAALEREEAKAKARAERGNKEVLSKAINGPQVGTKVLVKVGRWPYTGNVAAIYEDGDEVEVEFVDGKGNVKTVRKPKSEVQVAE